MNNKGQSLVSFVLLIPVLLLAMYMVYEIGRMTLLTNEINNISYLVIDMALDKKDNPDIVQIMREMALKNKTNISHVDAKVENDKVYLTIDGKLDGNMLSNMPIFKVHIQYVGYMDNGKKKIERVK